jgi:hypothetical protein
MENHMTPRQDICPICTQPFNYKDIVIDIERWDDEKMKAHLDCALYMSNDEKREHPPKSF